MAPSVKTITALRHLHPLPKIDLPPFVDYFHLEMDFILDREAFIYALTSFPHLSSNCFLSMVYTWLFCP
jgi:hypothetical protein